jgi:hypothetical protein
MSRAFRYQQPPDNNMDYGAAEMLADQRRMIREHAEFQPMEEFRGRMARKREQREEPGQGLNLPRSERSMARGRGPHRREGAPPHNLTGITHHGSLTHSKAHSSFVATPATHLGKPGGLRMEHHSRGRRRER